MVTATRVNPDCRNASNPYHECVEYCSRIISEVQASKKTEEKQVVQVNPDCTNASMFGYFSGRMAEVQASKKTEEKEVVQVNPDCRNSYIPDHEVEYCSRRIVKVKAGEKGEETEVAQVKDDVKTSSSDSCASVGAYRVRQDTASTLQLIFDKHGDIAANSRLRSTSMRAFYLESICSVVQELKSTDFKRLLKSKLKEMLAVLSDLESAQIDVSWLLNVLGDVEEAVEEYDAAVVERCECDGAIESTMRELESLRMDLAQQEKAADDARARVAKAKSQVYKSSRRVRDQVRQCFHWD